ncbi:MAG TPA: DUF3558 domain-containing protein [Pseudonocardiaceae bacterium]|nr:DUF3558 domain-containing protein [Pseudonocardiaceae bacterium]
MRHRLLASLVAVGSVLVAAGCGSDTSAAPVPAQPSPAPAASPIPPVNHPRDVAAMARRPCELLTAQQATGFGFNLPPEESDGLFGTLDCQWSKTTREQQLVRSLDITMFTNNPTLEVAYSRDHRGLPFFELTEVAGYPAIVTRTNADIAHCDIDVKAAERQSVTVTYHSEEQALRNNPQQSCEVGKQIAAAVLMNLPPKS